MYKRQIPEGAEIISAKLRLNFDLAVEGALANIHRLTRDWLEGTGNGTESNDGVTWLTYDGVNPWAEEGGDYDPAEYASKRLDGAGFNEIEIKNLVQLWVDGEYPNYGFIIDNPVQWADAWFYSREAEDPALRPELVIEYVATETITLSPEADAYIRGYNEQSDNPSMFVNTNNGNTVDLWVNTKFGPYSRALMKFDLSSIPEGAEIISAKLRLNFDLAVEGALANIHRLTRCV